MREQPHFSNVEGLSKSELQILWLVGTLGRLSSSGLIVNSPLALSQESISLYLHLDPKSLFSLEEELKDILYSLILACNKNCKGDPDKILSSIDSDFPTLSELVMEYRDNPSEVARREMEFSIEKGL